MAVAIKKVYHRHLRKEIKEKIQSCGYRIDDKNAAWFVASLEKQWCGFGGVWTLNNNISYVGPSFVKEEYRGQGIQRKLIDARLDFLKSKGIVECWSRTDLINVISANNLIKCGFLLKRPTVIGMLEGGNLSVTLDGDEILCAGPTEMFFWRKI